jgi:hypothetical protein
MPAVGALSADRFESPFVIVQRVMERRMTGSYREFERDVLRYRDAFIECAARMATVMIARSTSRPGLAERNLGMSPLLEDGLRIIERAERPVVPVDDDGFGMAG